MATITYYKMIDAIDFLEKKYEVKFDEYDETFETCYYYHLNFRGFIIYKESCEIRLINSGGLMYKFNDKEMCKKGLLKHTNKIDK